MWNVKNFLAHQVEPIDFSVSQLKFVHQCMRVIFHTQKQKINVGTNPNNDFTMTQQTMPVNASPSPRQKFLTLGLNCAAMVNQQDGKQISCQLRFLTSRVHVFTQELWRAFGMIFKLVLSTTCALMLPSSLDTFFLFTSGWTHESEKDLHTTFGCTEKSIHTWCKDITFWIAALCKLKVHVLSLWEKCFSCFCIILIWNSLFQIDSMWEDDDGFVSCVTVDGIHHKMDEPCPFLTSFFSHKEGGNACPCCEHCLCSHNDKTNVKEGGTASVVDFALLPLSQKQHHTTLKNQVSTNHEQQSVGNMEGCCWWGAG